MICDKRFTSVRLEYYDASLEVSLNSVAKRDILSAVRKIIANGVVDLQDLSEKNIPKKKKLMKATL